MFEWLSTDGFPARWHCGLRWEENPEIGWMSIFGDLFTFAAYLAVPLVIFLWVGRLIPSVRTHWVAYGASGFFVLCGSDHAISAIQFYWPIYPLGAIEKAATAALSWATVLGGSHLALALIRRDKNQSLEFAQLQQQARTLLSRMVEGVYMVDAAGRTLWANDRVTEILGWEQADMLGKCQHKILHHSRVSEYGQLEEYPVKECPIYLAFKTGKVQDVRHEMFFHKDGSCIPVRYSSSPVVDEFGRSVGALVIFSPYNDSEIGAQIRDATGSLMEAAQAVSEFREIIRQRREDN